MWVVLGTIFMGAVHDFGALVISIREGGRSIADIAGKVITPRVRLMFLTFVMVLSWLVVAVFAMAIAGLFRTIPSSVMPVNLEIIVALVIGWLVYKKKIGALVPSLVALCLLYFFVWLGPSMKVDFTLAPGSEGTILGLGWTKEQSSTFWVVFLLFYAGVASLLPVWLLLQPRDFINSHQLVVGLSMLFLGVIITNPEIDAPWIRTETEGAPPIIPFLFVTIACGAISGFHSLVSSGTTSKQIRSMKHARMIGYGSMLGEGSLAMASVLAAVAGIALVGQCTLPGQGLVSDLSWGTYYDTWTNAGKNSSTAFVLGGAQFIQSLGLPGDFSRTLMAVLVVSFAATTLDTATRIQRFIVSELGGALKFPPLTNRYIATIVALVPALLLVFATAVDPSTGQTKQVAWILWPIFGASNQMLASLTLMVLALYFWATEATDPAPADPDVAGDGDHHHRPAPEDMGFLPTGKRAPRGPECLDAHHDRLDAPGGARRGDTVATRIPDRAVLSPSDRATNPSSAGISVHPRDPADFSRVHGTIRPSPAVRRAIAGVRPCCSLGIESQRIGVAGHRTQRLGNRLRGVLSVGLRSAARLV